MTEPPRLFHGGQPGLRIGDLLKPGHKRRQHEGCGWCAAREAGTAVNDPASHRKERIYITTDRDYARFYASLYGYGDLYRVEPVGEVEPSTEDHFDSWVAPAARVVGIMARAVRLTPGERRRLHGKWTAADFRGTPLAALLAGEQQ